MNRILAYLLPIIGLVLLIYLICIFFVSKNESLYQYKNIIILSSILFLCFLIGSLVANEMRCIISNEEVNLKNIIELTLYFPKRFTGIAFAPLLLVSSAIAISNISLIIHERFRITKLLGFYLGIGVTIATLGLQFIEKLVYENTLNVSNTFLTIFSYSYTFLLIMLCYFECLYFATCIMAYCASKQKPKYNKDFIIILGCAIDNKGALLPLLRGRVNAAIKYAWQQEISSGIPVKYVPSGGKGSDEVMSEASAIELYLLSHGAEEYEVIPEKKSTNTIENMRFSKEIIDSINPEANVAFATSDFHMLRSGILASEAGFKDIEGVASKSKWYFWPYGFMREFVALLLMHKKDHLKMCISTFIFCIILTILSATI